MEAYTSFAAVYDTFMDNVPYSEWAQYIRGLLLDPAQRTGLFWTWGAGQARLRSFWPVMDMI